jgi:hypothetical protein
MVAYLLIMYIKLQPSSNVYYLISVLMNYVLIYIKLIRILFYINYI